MTIDDELQELGFTRFAELVGRDLKIEIELKRSPAVYVAVLDGKVFWVGETGNAKERFRAYRRWFALPDNSRRRDVWPRNQLLEMTGGRVLTFLHKQPMTIWSALTSQHYPAHRVEETIFIDHFQPAWNKRPGGRGRG